MSVLVCVCVRARMRACTGAHMTFEDLLCLQSFSLQHNRPINQGVNYSIYYSNRCLIGVGTTETKKIRKDKELNKAVMRML